MMAYMALVAGVKPSADYGANSVVPALFDETLPAGLAGLGRSRLRRAARPGAQPRRRLRRHGVARMLRRAGEQPAPSGERLSERRAGGYNRGTRGRSSVG